MTEKALAATILSFNRKQRFQDNDIPEGIFNEIQCQVMEKALMGETILYTDSTHIKARANKHKKTTFVVGRTPKAYLEKLDKAIDRDRKELDKKFFDKKSSSESGQLRKEGCRMASITASTGPWTASTTLW